MADDPAPAPPPPHFDVRSFLVRAAVGLIFVLLVSLPVTVLVLQDDADPTWIQRVVIYVCLALAAGIIFSVATVSSGKVEWRKLGVSLGGGAAIGVGSIILVHSLLPPPPALAIVRPITAGLASAVEQGDAIAEVIPLGRNRFVICRTPSGPAADAVVRFETIEPTSSGEPIRRSLWYRISRTGRAKPITEGQDP